MQTCLQAMRARAGFRKPLEHFQDDVKIASVQQAISLIQHEEFDCIYIQLPSLHQVQQTAWMVKYVRNRSILWCTQALELAH